jgi:transposase
MKMMLNICKLKKNTQLRLLEYFVLEVSSFHHQRINHLTHFAKGKNHINGIENFWNQAKRVLRNYDGIHTDSLPLFKKRV